MLSTPAALAHWNPHLLLEPAAFVVGGFLYWRGSNSDGSNSSYGARLPDAMSRWAVIAGAALGAAIGSRLLYVLEYWTVLQSQPWTMWLGGKTLVGALLGGLAGVEIAKLTIGWRQSTGDGFVTPLLVAITIGRLGCQLSTVTDQTYGNPTALPWAWDFGDAVPRHPTSLYEIIGLLGLAWLIHRARFASEPGDRFRLFMVGYLLLRLALEFLKPPFGPTAIGALTPDRWGPLAAIQWACAAGLAYYLPTSRRWLTSAQGT